jgi:hypothetical protein
MKQCECCGELFVGEELPPPPYEGDALLALCRIIGMGAYGNVCDAAECQAYAQNQCDEFDRARKSE